MPRRLTYHDLFNPTEPDRQAVARREILRVLVRKFPAPPSEVRSALTKAALLLCERTDGKARNPTELERAIREVCLFLLEEGVVRLSGSWLRRRRYWENRRLPVTGSAECLKPRKIEYCIFCGQRITAARRPQHEWCVTCEKGPGCWKCLGEPEHPAESRCVICRPIL